MRQDSVLFMSGDTRSDMRNYAMVAGYFALFALSLFMVICLFRGDLDFNTNDLEKEYVHIMLATTTVLILSGVSLAILHKRDLTAITFILLSVWPLTCVVGGTYAGIIPIGIIFVIFGLIVLTTKDEQRWFSGFLLVITGVKSIMVLINQIPIAGYLDIVLMLIALYACIAIMHERKAMPFRNLLTADEKGKDDGEQIYFKNSGSALGYALFASVLTGYALTRLQVGNITMVDCSWIEQIAGVLLIALSLIMLIAGKMRFTPFMFMMAGIGMFAAGADEYWLQAGIFMLIGIMTLMHRDPKVLPGVVFFIYGLFMIVLGFTNGAFDFSTLASQIAIVVDIVLIAILMYVIAGLYHENIKLI